MEQKINESKNREKDQFTVVLESINSKIDLVVEGHQALNQRLDRMENKFSGLEGKFDRLESDLIEFKIETKNNFKLVFEHIDRVEQNIMDEMQMKVPLSLFASLVQRVEKLEK